MIILFDLDGTLIDSTEAILEGFHHSYDSLEHSHAKDEDIKALIGYPLDVMYRELGVQESLISNFIQTYKKHYREIFTQKTNFLDGSKEAIVLASQFASLGIVTTKTGKFSQELMEYFEIMNYFKILIGREQVEYPKPHPEPILKALQSFQTKGEEIWMIGDTKLDLISAKDAGVNSIGVLSGYDNRETLAKFTDILFDDVLEAVRYLKSK